MRLREYALQARRAQGGRALGGAAEGPAQTALGHSAEAAQPEDVLHIHWISRLLFVHRLMDVLSAHCPVSVLAMKNFKMLQQVAQHYALPH